MMEGMENMAPLAKLLDDLGPKPETDAVFDAFSKYAESKGTPMYQHQADALLATLMDANTIITTPTGSGKSMIATAAMVATLAERGRVYYTAPIKALVSEKFFSWCDDFGADLVGMVTGDASVNPDAPIICCTAEILANIALREGEDADIDCVIMDEFHFIADPDRGWAWQVALTELPAAQFVIMSATLGDVTDLAKKLEEVTDYPVEVISGVERPVPLQYEWSMMPLPEKLEELVATGQAPVYLVHPSQKMATEAASKLHTTKLISTEQRRQIADAIRDFRFAPGFGKTLRSMILSGVGVHHAGLLPKYRRLVENLAQAGLLKVICGTDTLGVGVNVPIRTVVFTQLSKFDGRRDRVLRSREFHQIAGRAGRAGFDTIGYVVAQAPEHQIENAKIEAKFADNPKKLKSVRKKKAPDGFINYTEDTFNKLINSTPETLHARMKITYSMLINLLSRDQDTAEAVVNLVNDSTESIQHRHRLYRRAIQLGRSLIRDGVVVQRDEPTPGGRKYDLAPDLQDDFALNQPLAGFAINFIDALDVESPDYALDVVSVMEATLEDPMQILYAQQSFERGKAVAEMKADGLDYLDRQKEAEEITWPQPLAEELEEALMPILARQPWLGAAPLSPKSIVRDMYERAMTFGEFVAHYKITRSEGLLLRYLSDAWRALRQTVPPESRTPELEEIIDWLGETIKMTDSSLVDEWEAMNDPTRTVEEVRKAAEAPERPLTGNKTAFRRLVRNAMFRRVLLMADDDVEALADLDGEDSEWTIDDWDDALGDYWDEHEEMGVGAEARGPSLFIVENPADRVWKVRQIIDDPEGNHDWQVSAEVDLDASDEAGELVLEISEFDRKD
ncbi:hypothetical protein HMPREF9306_00283 [Propionimicrobium lymphophilum ACS-093-V-SCH5]|uniref:Uncharacterized protein n=1 Tax=Propionimicrobium lymphophilum ACS-093-V-SCH5 TaxID=883161 RepID=S2WMH2_9ACTN|nr:hypothetical protein HMPREF9306_00283 [Propionimicrobium lymphophilum ACS-093-V-SCH5]